MKRRLRSKDKFVIQRKRVVTDVFVMSTIHMWNHFRSYATRRDMEKALAALKSKKWVFRMGERSK